MKLFFGKGKAVEEKIYAYLNYINETKNLFKRIITNFFEGKVTEKFNEEVLSVHFKESQADDLRREIECHLYGKALLPEFRGDILGLLEELDKLPNKCETVLFMINLQNMHIPQFLRDDFIELIDINLKSIDESINLVTTLFQAPKNVGAIVESLDKIESESDRKEREMIKKLFDAKEVETCEKILLKELILEIGSISDFGEMIGDMVNIINIKVKV